jgi:hypothetical protein
MGTGLVWVDLDNFFNQSTIQMKATVEAAGFTFADKSSVETLLSGLPLTNPPTEWNSYVPIMGFDPVNSLIWGSYDNGLNNGVAGLGYAYSSQVGWSFIDNWVSNNAPNNGQNIFAYQSASTSVPEPFTIVGTLVGGTAALRLKKKLKSAHKV